MTAAPAPILPSDAITIDLLEASRLTGLSPKTLTRKSDEGQPTGRVRVGRRVLFVRDRLAAWLSSMADSDAGPQPVATPAG
jgi:hypothetical protein